jgi:hypothetical protein
MYREVILLQSLLFMHGFYILYLIYNLFN